MRIRLAHSTSTLLLLAMLLLTHPNMMGQDAGFGPVAAPGPIADPAGSTPYAPDPSASMAGQDGTSSSKTTRTIIDSDRGASFDNTSNTAEFTGHVVVQDPKLHLSCDKLRVMLSPNHKGLSKAIAIGSVIIVQEKPNSRGDIVKSIGKCGKATYDAVTGDVTLEDWPQIQQGINNQVATEQATVMILNAKGRSRTIGSSRTVIVDQGAASAITP